MNVYGNTALHIACYNGQDSVVNELIDYGANVNQPNNSGFTPLHFAAASTHGALCLELLVNNGADVNIQVQLTFHLFNFSCLNIYPLWFKISACHKRLQVRITKCSVTVKSSGNWLME